MTDKSDRCRTVSEARAQAGGGGGVCVCVVGAQPSKPSRAGRRGLNCLLGIDVAEGRNGWGDMTAFIVWSEGPQIPVPSPGGCGCGNGCPTHLVDRGSSGMMTSRSRVGGDWH